MKVVVLLHTYSHEEKVGDELAIDNYVVLFGKYISHELFSTVNCSLRGNFSLEKCDIHMKITWVHCLLNVPSKQTDIIIHCKSIN